LDTQVNSRAGEWRFENLVVMNCHGLFTISTWVGQEQQFEPVSHCSILFDFLAPEPNGRRRICSGAPTRALPQQTQNLTLESFAKAEKSLED
jgi:hypothetical protein